MSKNTHKQRPASHKRYRIEYRDEDDTTGYDFQYAATPDKAIHLVWQGKEGRVITDARLWSYAGDVGESTIRYPEAVDIFREPYREVKLTKRQVTNDEFGFVQEVEADSAKRKHLL